jgi:hypothetical protein
MSQVFDTLNHPLRRIAGEKRALAVDAAIAHPPPPPSHPPSHHYHDTPKTSGEAGEGGALQPIVIIGKRLELELVGKPTSSSSPPSSSSIGARVRIYPTCEL